MSKTWQLQDAKNRFSELIDTAIKDGPQKVTRRGRPVAVVVAAEEYDRMAAKDQGSLFEFFQSSPLASVALDLARNTDTDRNVEI